jgi:AMP-binding enzyme/Phosphopantetheine attachment site/AMP-binding enzyme C-terminal domain
VGLARGYLNRPDLTAEKFVPNPYGEAGSRMYRTGDIGRWLPDGNIEFIGRMDDQVKVRGFRIELGEVEGALRELDQVREAVVVAREDESGQKELIGYVVARQGQKLVVQEVREQLGRKLPQHMVPTGWVELDALPLNANGKVDRKALPAPSGARQVGREYVAPRTAMEEVLAEIWSQVLKVDRVGVHDDFFELGGHSLRAAQVISKIRSILSRDTTLKVLFESRTIESLATHLAKTNQKEPPTRIAKRSSRTQFVRS